ncbi:unnamed protein product, partial [Ectocarpus sp. 12 AP-2014]
ITLRDPLTTCTNSSATLHCPLHRADFAVVEYLILSEGMDMDIPLQQQQQQQQQQHRQRHHVQQQQPWPQHEAQGHHEVSKQPLPHNPQQQQQQTLVRDADQRPSPLLSDYVPPAGFTHVNVPVLLQQTASAIVRWEELQKSLDVRSDSAPANLAAQAHVRSSLKRDLTN